MTRQGTPVLTFACETASSNEDLCLAILYAGADPTVVDEVVSATDYVIFICLALRWMYAYLYVLTTF